MSKPHDTTLPQPGLEVVPNDGSAPEVLRAPDPMYQSFEHGVEAYQPLCSPYSVEKHAMLQPDSADVASHTSPRKKRFWGSHRAWTLMFTLLALVVGISIGAGISLGATSAQHDQCNTTSVAPSPTSTPSLSTTIDSACNGGSSFISNVTNYPYSIECDTSLDPGSTQYLLAPGFVATFLGDCIAVCDAYNVFNTSAIMNVAIWNQNSTAQNGTLLPGLCTCWAALGHWSTMAFDGQVAVTLPITFA